MLDVLVKSSVRRKIVAFFSMNGDRKFYPRFVAGQIQESPHAVGLELVYLFQNSVLIRVQEGGRFYYQWNDKYAFASLLQQTINKMREQGNQEMMSIPCLSYRERLMQNLERVVSDIKKYYHPEKIILFGSAAAGKTGPHSDLDLVIIKDISLPFFKRVQQLVDLLDYDVDIDFLVYTPAEFEQAIRQKKFFKEEILKKGKVLYVKAA